MRNYFTVKGYAVNKRGLTKGISYDVFAEDAVKAREMAVKCAERDGFSYIRITRTLPSASPMEGVFHA